MSTNPAKLVSDTHHSSAGVGAPPSPDTGGTSSDARFHARAGPVRPRRGNLKAPKRPGDRWAVEFSLRGQRQYVSFPDSANWDRDRAEGEQRFLMEKVNRGEWKPPPRAPEPDTRPAEAPLYAEVAALALARQIKRVDEPEGKRARQLEYQLSIGLDLLGPRPVDQVDEAAVEEMV